MAVGGVGVITFTDPLRPPKPKSTSTLAGRRRKHFLYSRYTAAVRHWQYEVCTAAALAACQRYRPSPQAFLPHFPISSQFHLLHLHTMSQKVYSVVSNKSGKTYYLHLKRQERKNGGTTDLYYFAGEVKEGAIADLPSNKEVVENERTGLPMLKTKGK